MLASLRRSAPARLAMTAYVAAFFAYLFAPLIVVAIFAFNDSIARGGTGLVTMGVVGVGWPLGNNMRRQPAISQDRFIPGMRRVADVVHAAGAKFAVQLHFGGLVANPEAGQPAW